MVSFKSKKDKITPYEYFFNTFRATYSCWAELEALRYEDGRFVLEGEIGRSSVEKIDGRDQLPNLYSVSIVE